MYRQSALHTVTGIMRLKVAFVSWMCSSHTNSNATDQNNCITVVKPMNLRLSPQRQGHTINADGSQCFAAALFTCDDLLLL